ncbi:MAG: thiamine-binding protein [Gammaproteobacteria bacterium]|nr:thiamine-binding protein [Gammaproteobacteria bacterium]MDH5629177.1 thiamine-binding protein [Gammaproteobacteria bacterium]
MNISIEMSLYPLDDNFLSIIKDIVKRLNSAENIVCKTNTMSTQIFGECNIVMQLLNEIVQYSFTTYGRQVFIVKILNGDVRPENG